MYYLPLPVMSNLQEHRFERYTLVSKVYDIVMGIENVYEIEGVISKRHSCFLNRSNPLFPMTDGLLRPREEKLLKNYILFIDI